MESPHPLGDGIYQSWDRFGRLAPKVLLAEDEPVFHEIIRELLARNGFSVVTVRDGVEGLHSVLANEFEIILCDTMMPALPGDLFYRAVERVRPHLCARFVFMTGLSGSGRMNDFIRSVQGAALAKPFRVDELLEVIAFVQMRAGVKPKP